MTSNIKPHPSSASPVLIYCRIAAIRQTRESERITEPGGQLPRVSGGEGLRRPGCLLRLHQRREPRRSASADQGADALSRGGPPVGRPFRAAQVTTGDTPLINTRRTSRQLSQAKILTASGCSLERGLPTRWTERHGSNTRKAACAAPGFAMEARRHHNAQRQPFHGADF